MRKYLLIVALAFPLAGCNTLRKVLPQYAKDQGPESHAVPDDFTVKGTTFADYQWVTNVQCAGRQVIVKVLRPNETEWDTANEFEVTIDTIGAGGGGILFRRICYPTYNGDGKLIYLVLTGKPYAPIGTQYEIRSLALATDHSLY